MFLLSKILLVVLILVTTDSEAVNQLKFNDGDFNVSWSYLSASQEIEFEVRARTTAYVALGISKTNSGMQALDLFAGGVDSRGNYLEDYYAERMESPMKDKQQDYTLISASESNGITMVHCKRRLDTQDDKDLKIQPGEKMYFAWAIGTSDSFSYHGNTQSNRDYSIMYELVPKPQTTTSSPTTTPTTTPSIRIAYNKEISFQAGNFLVFWKYESSTNELFFKLEVKATGWVGLGFSNTNSAMREMDVVIAGVSGGQGYIRDYYSTSKSTPQPDSSQDYTLLSSTESEGTTTVEFKRKINTGDNKDLQIVPGTSYYIGWAYHSSGDSLQYHSARNYSLQKIIFIQVTTTMPTTVSTAITTTIPIPSPTTTISPTTTAKPPTTTAISPTTTAIPPTTTAIPPTTTAKPPSTTGIPPTTTAKPPTTTAKPPTTTTAVSPNPNPRTVGYNKELAFKSGDFYVFWKFDSSTNELVFKLTVKATGWVGLGFSNINSGMSDMDIVIAGVSAGQGYIGDYHSTGKESPPRDSLQDYILLNATETEGTTTVEFKRKINTGDDKDLQIKPGASYYLGWAYHSSIDSLIQHSKRDYSGQKVVLVADDDDNTTISTTPTTETLTPTPTTETPTTTAAMTTCHVVLLLLGIFASLGAQ